MVALIRHFVIAIVLIVVCTLALPLFSIAIAAGRKDELEELLLNITKDLDV